jgi:glycerophosphoryl diester phosphodiesterase
MRSLTFPRIIGHRGAAASAPENTLAGLRRAAELGASWVEFDVRLSADRRCVLLHDETVERTSNGGARNARDLTLDELKRLDAGAWFGPGFAGERIPTLEETIEMLAGAGLGANIEIKPSPDQEAETAKAALAIVKALWPSRLPVPLISSFKEASLAAAREAAPDLPRGLLLGAIPPDWRQRAEDLDCMTIHCDHRRLEPPIVRAMTEAGYPVLAYTVNDPARAATLFEWGVAAVITDAPERVAEAAP